MGYDTKEVAIKTAKTLEDFVNAYNFDANEFVDQITWRAHRTLQQGIGGVVFKLIKRWSEMYKNENYDGRNQALCQMCHNIDQLMTHEHNSENWDNLPLV